jgi:hypothetical protein
MALQNPGFWLVDVRSVKCVSGVIPDRTRGPYFSVSGPVSRMSIDNLHVRQIFDLGKKK